MRYTYPDNSRTAGTSREEDRRPFLDLPKETHSMLTQSAPVGYARGAEGYADLEAAIDRALELRRELGLDPDRAYPDDAWVLASYLREEVRLVVRPQSSSYILYRKDAPDTIYLQDDLGSWEESFTLSHELGHFLCTQPPPEAFGAGWKVWNTPEVSRRAELLANAFAFAFTLFTTAGGAEQFGEEPGCCEMES